MITKEAARMKANRATRKANGMCVDTGCHDLAILGRTQCKTHRIKEAKRKKQTQLEHVALGLCRFCSEASIGVNLCEYHYLRRKAHMNLGSGKHWQFLKNLLLEQDNKCFYCGTLLQLTVNSEIDHKNPKSRFPDQVKNPNNVVWACGPCNQGKGNLTTEEFIALCRRVAAKWPI